MCESGHGFALQRISFNAVLPKASLWYVKPTRHLSPHHSNFSGSAAWSVHETEKSYTKSQHDVDARELTERLSDVIPKNWASSKLE